MPELPARLDTLIVHMLARSAGDRVPSAADARDALNPALIFAGWEGGSAGPRARPQLQLTSAGFTVHPSLQPTLQMPEEKKKSKGPRIAAGTAVVAVIGMLGGLLYWSQRGAVPAKTSDTTTVKPPVVIAADSVPAVAPKALPRLDSASFLRAQKAGTVKEVRAAVPGLGLAEAKALVEGAPKSLKEGVTKEEAEDIKKKIEAAGGTIEIK